VLVSGRTGSAALPERRDCESVSGGRPTAEASYSVWTVRVGARSTVGLAMSEDGLEDEVVSWRARQGVFRLGWVMGNDSYRRLGLLSDECVHSIRAVVRWLFERVPRLGQEGLGQRGRRWVDDTLGYLDNRYRLCLMWAGTTLREEPRSWSVHSVTSLCALAFVCELRGVTRRARFRDVEAEVVVIKDSEGSEEDSPAGV
jgi:hypothetical protein